MKTKKSVLAVVFASAMMLLLSACSSILEGTVVGKNHSESYQEAYQTCMIYDSENPGVCKMYTTNYRTIPEKWTVVIQGENDKGETKYVTYSIPEHNWDQTYEGDYMKFNEQKQLIEHTGKLR